MKTQNLQLIEGQFSSQEAKELLMNIFNDKIRFHEMKNFSSQERYGTDDATAQKRIPKLRQEMVKLKEIVDQAELKNQNLQIFSEIKISVIEKE